MAAKNREVIMQLFGKEPDEVSNPIGRRAFLAATGAAAIVFAWSYFRKNDPVRPVEASPALPKNVTIVEFTDAGVRKSSVTLPRIVKTEAEWQKQLDRDSFEITREAGTEGPYTNEDPNDHAKGIFRCICCDTALFDANTKFESGTGWPSFWQPIAKENVLEITDTSFGMTRTAVSCRLCDAHLGHVFDDGPEPTGLRYCMNSVAMRFAKTGS